MSRWLRLRYIGWTVLSLALYESLFAISSGTNRIKIGIVASKQAVVVADSSQLPKPSVLVIKAFASDISKPLPSALVIITSLTTGKIEQFTLLTGQLERSFKASDQLLINVSAPGYTSINRKMSITVSPKGNRYEFDAELDRMAIGLTVSAVDRQTGKIIRGVRFTISSKATGTTSVTLTPDSTTGLSKIELPGRGIYVLSSSAKGYADFIKSIKLDSAQNEAQFILVAKQLPAVTKPVAKTIAVSESPVIQSVAKVAATAPVATSAASASLIGTKSLDKLEKGKTVQLNNLYFDQSSPVLRPESYTELDQLYSILNENQSIQIEIRGHTDNQGDFDLNTKLSRDRCQAVVDYLVNKGVSKSRLRAVGRGPIDPIAPNNNEENRKKNRRVEIVVL